MTFLALQDAERIDRLIAESDALDAAWLTNAAVCDSKQLVERQSALMSKLRKDPNEAPPSPRPPREELERAAREIFARIKLKKIL